MTITITEQQITDLEAVLAQATRPPWRVNHTRSSRGLFIEDCTGATSPLDQGRWICGEINNNGEDQINLANADLITAAVNTLPALLAAARERTRLHTALSNLRAAARTYEALRSPTEDGECVYCGLNVDTETHTDSCEYADALDALERAQTAADEALREVDNA